MIDGIVRVLVAGFMTLLLCSAQNPGEPHHVAKEAKNNSAIPATASTKVPLGSRDFKPYRGYDPDPCYNIDNHDVADLCAQWRSAIAAETASREARRATTWSIVATVLNAIGLIFVAAAFYLTIQSNKIARDSAVRQLRAYLSIEPGGVNEATDRGHRVPLQLINQGQTPAHRIEIFADFLIVSGDPREFDPAEYGRYSGTTTVSQLTVAGASSMWTYSYMPADLPKEYWSASVLQRVR